VKKSERFFIFAKQGTKEEISAFLLHKCDARSVAIRLISACRYPAKGLLLAMIKGSCFGRKLGINDGFILGFRAGLIDITL
jgi:hypothetical protein